MPSSAPPTELRLRAAVESSPSGLLMIDRGGRIVLVNREVERLFGYSREELLGHPVEMLVPERFRGGHAAFRAGFFGEPRMRAMGAGRELFGLRKDGTEVPVEIGLTPVATDEGMFVLSSIVDIAERKNAEQERRRLETRLHQAEKMEAVGTLAGGIAHDFNNILGLVVGYAEVLKLQCRDPQSLADIAELLGAAERGKHLVERILAFSRRQEVSRQPLALGQTLSHAAKLLRSTLPASIDIQVDVAADTPRVLADPTSVHQILMNLATNARDAMQGGGTISLSAQPLYVRDSMARANPDLHEGPYAMLRVADSGQGMTHEIQERVFEPFFTTKAPAAGTGLGLAVVHGIMKEHQGAVLLESEPGVGTTIRCLFPAIELEAHEPPPVEPDVPTGQGQRILLLDDEPALARVTARTLSALNYEVTALTGSAEALETFRRDPAAFDLVLTDYSMPGMSGLELAREIEKLRPGVPVILLTGFIENLADSALRGTGLKTLLRKPVSSRELARALHEALHADPSRPS